MFNDIVLFLFIPLLLLGTLWRVYGLMMGEEDSSKQMTVMLGGFMGAVLMFILAILFSQVFDIRYLSFDPFAYLLPQAALILMTILLNAFFTFIILYFTQSLVQKGKGQYAAAIYGAAFVFLIYAGYFNLFLETLAAFVIFGILMGVLILVVFGRYIREEV